jgi:S1-C subfamily serine protease
VDVNPVSEQDLELLEDYLDGALAPEESARLRTRLADESDFAEALDELRDQRASRAAVWASLEPGEDDADRFAERVITAARRQDRQSRVWRMGRFGGVAAACMLLGVFMGWLGRDRGPALPLTSTFDPSVGIVSGPPVSTEPLGVVVREIQVKDSPRTPRPMLIVSEITSPPAAGGKGLEVGDLLLTIDGERVPNVAALATVLSSRSGMRVLRILRDGQVHEVAIRYERH